MANVQRIDAAGGPGRLANRRGAEARAEVEALLGAAGYGVTRHVAIGESIYGTKLHADLVVEECAQWPDGLIVEVISQTAAGSADQKFPFLVENIRQRYPCPAIVVLIGEGFSEGAVSWLRDQIDGRKLLDVATLDQFQTFMRRPLAG